MTKNYTGLIIGVKNTSDSNRTVELMTKDDGIVKVFASGARNLSSRFMSITNLYTLVSFECSENGTMNVLTDGKLLTGYYNMTDNLEKFSLVAEVLGNIKIAMTTAENKSHFYGLAISYMEMLDKLDFDDNNEDIAAMTAKLYTFMLAFLGVDVEAAAREYGATTALADVCRSLKGKRVSEAMTTTELPGDVYGAFETLKRIYREMFDIYIEAEF